MVNGRAKVMPLLETDTAADNLPEAVKVSGIDQMHIGLNDLHLCYHQKFMFQLLTDGTVDRLCAELREASIPYGFGGVGRPGSGTLPAEYIIGEHYRLGSQYVDPVPQLPATRRRRRTWMKYGAFLPMVWRISAAWRGTAPLGRRSSLTRITAWFAPALRTL